MTTPGTGQRPAPRLAFLVPALLAGAAWIASTPALAERLVLDRAAVARGELWRLVTWQLVHRSPRLLLLDVGALALLAGLLARRDRILFGLALPAAALAVSAAIWLARPDLRQAEGASGLVAGLLAALGADLVRTPGRTRVPWASGALGALALAAAFAKPALEAAGLLPSATGTAGVVLWEAHLAGAAAGTLTVLLRHGPGSARVARVRDVEP